MRESYTRPNERPRSPRSVVLRPRLINKLLLVVLGGFSKTKILVQPLYHADSLLPPTPTHSLLDKILDPEFETKYAAEADAHAKQNSAWIQQGMKSDAEKHGK